MMSGLEQAREALRIRQGQGARYDAPEAPAGALALARSGTAFFARCLNGLRGPELYAPSMIDGLSRAGVICSVAYQARAIARQAEMLMQGLTAPPLHDSEEQRMSAILLGSTLPPQAVRHLFDHSAIHLDVVWRDLPGQLWDAQAPGEDGQNRPLRRTATERAQALWQGALDLGGGARLRDLPASMRPD